MFKILIASFGREGFTYVRNSRQLGMYVRVLDCFDRYHKRLARWYGDEVLQVAGRRSDVRDTVAPERFDVAIVQEEADFVRAALVTQSLREAGIGNIIVVTPDAAKRTVYRRCGATRVVVAESAEEAWGLLNRYLPSFQTA